MHLYWHVKRITSLFFILPLYLFGQSDFGDAPDPSYPTLFMNNGASHQLSPLFLGKYIDPEMDGQPNTACTGDDLSGGPNDEDGIVFKTWLIPGQTCTLQVVTTGAGNLDAWIDFQNNSNWTDPGDQIFIAKALTAGTNTLAFTVPSSAVPSTTYARFRLSTVGGLPPFGGTVDGEVEDYQVRIGAPPTGLQILDPDPAGYYIQNEISIAAAQTSNFIAVAYNDNPYPGGPGIGVSLSSDLGSSWRNYQLSLPAHPKTGISLIDAFDPSIVVDDSSNAYLIHISTDYNWIAGPENGLFIHKWDAKNSQWKNPKTISFDTAAVSSPDPNYKFNDRCQLRIDPYKSSSNYQNLYAVWIKDRGWNMSQPTSDIFFSASLDKGQTFTPPLQINSSASNLANMPILDVAANGNLYLSWLDYDVTKGGTGIIFMAKSTDGGKTWIHEQVIDTIALPPLLLNNGTETRAKGAPILRCDPSDTNTLYMVYAGADTTYNDEGNIYYIQSNDRGKTWTTPWVVNDDNVVQTQILPWFEVSKSGLLSIAWYDRRHDISNTKWDVYYTESSTGGAIFHLNLRVTQNSFTTPQNQGGFWLGEYLGLAIKDTNVFIGYTSSAMDLKGDVAFKRLRLKNAVGQIELSQEKVFVYPNPFNDLIKIRLNEQAEAEIFLYDLSGRIILEKHCVNTEETLNTTHLKRGTYLISMKVNDRITYRKMVKH